MDERGAARRPVLDSRVRCAGRACLRQSVAMAGRALLLRAEPGFSLPAFERFAPPPPPALVTARLEASSQPGEIVLDLFGRGGWVARAAIDMQRKGISLESTPLDRLLAELVLRPPDLRHLDAAVQALAASARRESSLKASIADRFASRCATCDRPGRPRRADLDGRGEGRGRHAAAGRAGPQALPLPDLPRPAGRRGAAPGAARRAGPRRAPATRRGSSCGSRSPPGSRCSRAARTCRASCSASTRRASCPRSARSSSGSRTTSAPRRSRRRSGSRCSTRSRPRAGSRRRPAGSRRSGSRTATSRSRARRNGASATRGSRSRTGSGSCAASSSGWRAAPGARCRRGSATTCGASSRDRRPPSSSSRTPAAIGALELEAEHLSRDGARPRIRLVARDAAAPSRRRPARLGVPRDGVGPRPGRRGVAPARAAVRAGGPAVVGLAGRGDHADACAASSRPSRRTRGSCSCSRATGPRRWSATVLGGHHRGLPARGGAAARGRARARRRRGARPAGLGRDPRRPADPGERRARPAAGRRRRPGPRARGAAVRAGRAGRRRAVLGPGRDARRRRRRGRRAQAPGRARDRDRARSARSSSASTGRATSGASSGRRPSEAAPDAAPPATPPEPVDHVERLLALIREALEGADGRRLVRIGDDRWWLGDRDRPGRGRRAARRPRRVGRVQPPVDRRADVRGAVPRADREPVHRPRPPRRGARPRLPRRAIAAWPARPTGCSPRTTSSSAARSTGERIADLVDLGHRLGLRVLDRRAPAAAPPRRRPARATGSTTASTPGRRRSAGSGARTSRTSTSSGTSAAGRRWLWEVEWTAMLGEPVLRRHARMADRRPRRAVPRRAPRAQRARPPQARPLAAPARRARGRQLAPASRRTTSATGRGATSRRSADLEPLLGLDPDVERTGDQMALFG